MRSSIPNSMSTCLRHVSSASIQQQSDWTPPLTTQAEQAEYEKEGVTWEKIEFQDNQGTDLLGVEVL